ncbi:MAG: hypothetical protein P8Y94_05870, partial [Acidobacteriota bacterium]
PAAAASAATRVVAPEGVIVEDRGMTEGPGFEADRVLFLEVQRFTQWWLRAILFGVAALSAWIFVQQIVLGRPFGNQGVELRLTNGRIILIGSQRSHELETAIRQAREIGDTK